MGRLDRTIRVAVWVLAMGWPTVACGWGRIGHDAVAYIAECMRRVVTSLSTEPFEAAAKTI